MKPHLFDITVFLQYLHVYIHIDEEITNFIDIQFSGFGENTHAQTLSFIY